jgi:hypothetical protein
MRRDLDAVIRPEQHLRCVKLAAEIVDVVLECHRIDQSDRLLEPGPIDAQRFG